MDKCKLGVISQERLNIEVKLLLNANRKSYMPRRLAQQRMTFGDLESDICGLKSEMTKQARPGQILN